MTQRCVFTLPDSGFPSEELQGQIKRAPPTWQRRQWKIKLDFIAVTDREASQPRQVVQLRAQEVEVGRKVNTLKMNVVSFIQPKLIKTVFQPTTYWLYFKEN